jgi:hypothetical protein
MFHISDHFPIFRFLNHSREPHKHKTICYRKINDLNIGKCKTKLTEESRIDTLNINDAQISFNNFNAKFDKIYYETFPLKEQGFNKKHSHKRKMDHKLPTNFAQAEK